MSSNTTIKDLLRKGTNRYTLIRKRARQKCETLGRLNQCQRCQYTNHVEVAHIKPIKEFSIDTLVSVVNDQSNLLILCPNCHWEYDNINKLNNKICSCGKKKNRTSQLCKICSNKKMKEYRISHSKCPSKCELEKLINEYPLTKIGEMFGVSNNAVKKWCMRHDIILGNRIGYWSKKRCKPNQI